MDPLFEKIVEIRASGRSAALCIVTSTEGSTPRGPGAKMIVHSDATIEGSVGGGSIETRVIEDALAAIRSGVPASRAYNLEADLAMACGGKAVVYIEPLLAAPRLYIFGAGHVGRFVAKYALDFGFTVTLFDERAEMFKDLEVPGCRIVLGDYLESIGSTAFGPDVFSVIVTPQHRRDEAVLGAVAARPGAYVGMIGSRRKVALVRDNLLAAGTLTAEQFDAVDAPIGLKFDARTPQEIAVSILAKIIDRKNSLSPER